MCIKGPYIIRVAYCKQAISGTLHFRNPLPESMERGIVLCVALLAMVQVSKQQDYDYEGTFIGSSMIEELSQTSYATTLSILGLFVLRIRI